VAADRTQFVFRIVVVAAIVAAFGQVTLGGVVRVSGSGLGCPDWPLCHGQLIPPFELTTLIEYSHRLSASVLSLLVLGTAITAWINYRHRTWVLIPSLLGLVLVIVAAALGGATVLTELAWWFVLIHLGVAELLVASLVVAAVAGWHSENSLGGVAYDNLSISRLETLSILTVLGVFVVILSGSYMVGYGAGSSCATWPLCRGSLMPEGTVYAIHMGHRFVVTIVGVLLVGTSVIAWSHRSTIPSVAWSGAILLLVFAIQIVLGAVIVWAEFTPETKAIHLSVATLVWVALIFMASLVYLPRLYSTERNFTTWRRGA
jgi:heme A synthase